MDDPNEHSSEMRARTLAAFLCVGVLSVTGYAQVGSSISVQQNDVTRVALLARQEAIAFEIDAIMLQYGGDEAHDAERRTTAAVRMESLVQEWRQAEMAVRTGTPSVPITPLRDAATLDALRSSFQAASRARLATGRCAGRLRQGAAMSADACAHDARAAIRAFVPGVQTGIARYRDATMRRVERLKSLAAATFGLTFVVMLLLLKNVIEPSLARSREHLAALLASARDLRAARNRAEEATRIKSAFLANMSHEIRTPMTAILGYAKLLGAMTPEQQTVAVHAIQRNGEHLLALINDLLDLSKLEAAALRLDPRPTRVDELVGDVIDVVRPQADAKGLRIEAHVDDRLEPTVLLDPVRVRQILINLAGNAVKFTEQGHVRIVLRRAADGQLRLEVQDTGIGMSPDQVARVFEDYEQADASTTRKFGGTGLGLAISRRLIELMGGAIRAHSVEGVGTTMIASFAAPASAERAECHRAGTPLPALQRPAKAANDNQEREPDRSDSSANTRSGSTLADAS